MKKITILKHSQGELANQLWNYISISAYGLETESTVRNPSFFEYHSYFNFLKKESFFTKFLSFWFKNSIKRRSSSRHRFWRKVYTNYAVVMKFLFEDKIISSENQESEAIYLPPTSPFSKLENGDDLYFVGWLFRNPLGIKKYRNQLVNIFAPNKEIEKKVTNIVTPLRQKYEKIIGVHIRQSDYRTWKGGVYFIEQKRVRQILDEYVRTNKLDLINTLFLITSEEQIDSTIFANLNTYISKENSVTDLFLLSSTDTIIGSDSTFGAWASWYGNIPHIVMENEPMDWQYYSDKKEYFENKYSKMVRY